MNSPLSSDLTEKWYIKYTFILALLIMTVYIMIVAKSVLQPLLFAFFFAILLSPLCGWLENYKVPRILAAIISIIFGLLILFGVGFFFFTQITAFVNDVEIFRQRFEEILASVQHFLETRFGFEGLINFELVRTTVYEFFSENTDSLARGLADAAAVFTSVVVVPVFVFFLLIFRDFLKEFTLRLFGRKSKEDLLKVSTILNNVRMVVQKYISGVIIVIIILAFLNSTMLWIIGVEHAIFFGVFAAMLNVIPFLGPIIGSILPILYALFTMDSLFYPLIILAGFYIIQLFESNLFTPAIVGSQVSMNAFIALLLLFIGAQIWGLIGMILIIPIGAILKVIFDEIESLQPYGFVMGRVPSRMEFKKGMLAQKISEFSEKVNPESADEGNTE